jgi:hypothetical protein
MTNIIIKKNSDQINKITIKGHCGYGVVGTDIVCSSISSIVITSLNAIIRFDEKSINYKKDEGFIEVDVLKHNKEVDILLENMISLLKELELNYKKNINIKEVTS